MPRMLRTLAAGAALAFVLASCSFIEDLAGPQQVSDPLGLHDVEVTLEPTVAPAVSPKATPAQATTPQATATYGASFGPVSVSDIDASGIPDWFDPDSLSVDLGIMATVRMESALGIDASEFSDTFVLDSASLAAFSIADGDGDPRVDLDPVSTPAGASVTLEKQSCTLAPLTCTYEAQSGLDAFVIPVFIDGAAVDQLYAIITGGAPTNTASGSLQLTATGTAPPDTTITVTMDAPSGTLDP